MSQQKGGNARSAKHKLTVIPEAEREVKYRLTLIVCGKGASDFCKQACASDVAQEIMAKVKGDEAKRRGSQEELASVTEEKEEPDRKAKVVPKDDAQDISRVRMPQRSDDESVMFLPVGETANQLARVRFETCEKFSDSLPQAKDRPQAVSTVVALFMPKPPNGSSLEEAARAATRDWMSRLAEIGFQKPKLRPYVATLTYGLDEEAEKAVMEFVTNSKVALTPIFSAEADDDAYIESLQTLVDKAVAAGDKLRRTGSLLSRGQSSAQQNGGKSSCCVVS